MIYELCYWRIDSPNNDPARILLAFIVSPSSTSLSPAATLFATLRPLSDGFPAAVLGFAGTSKINEPDQSDPTQPIHFDPTQPILLEPTPLRSEPYIPPTTDLSENTDFEEQVEQVMIVLPTHSTIEEKNKILETNQSAIILTGAAAALAQGGPTVGSVDIGENEDSYLFRVSIPGALKEDKFSCDVDPDGKVFIQGVTMTGGKIVCRDFHVFKMKTQNLCPPGHFSVSIQLPGPVESEQKIVSLENDGILEGIVKKKLP